ncbi:MAG: TauD/TfdA family dioxygenase, partial [Rhodospirillales bacterium]|nr:TauD/TfdA family dioxygenase [Rhodospirillales bacterium]
RRGGLTRAASVVAIHNEMARTAPDLLAALYEPVVYSWRNNQLPGTPPDYEHPVFAIVDGRFVSKYSPSYIEWGYKMRGLEMPQKIEAALAMVNRLANDPAFHLEKAFEPGDMQFANNLTMLHARTEFEDYEDPKERRHLLRLWLAVPDSARMPDSFGAFYGDTHAGAVRGGYPSAGPITFETVNVN